MQDIILSDASFSQGLMNNSSFLVTRHGMARLQVDIANYCRNARQTKIRQ